MQIETATSDHRTEVEALLRRSYTALLAPAYDAELLAQALPVLTRAQDTLLTSGRYFLLRDEGGKVVAAGGVTDAAPGTGVPTPGLAHIRHVAVDPDRSGEGIGRRLMEHLFDVARAADADRVESLSTLNAEPFYAAMGFTRTEPVDLSMGGIQFPSVRMHRPL